jgi:hypothetical protein
VLTKILVRLLVRLLRNKDIHTIRHLLFAAISDGATTSTTPNTAAIPDTTATPDHTDNTEPAPAAETPRPETNEPERAERLREQLIERGTRSGLSDEDIDFMLGELGMPGYQPHMLLRYQIIGSVLLPTEHVQHDGFHASTRAAITAAITGAFGQTINEHFISLDLATKHA